MQYNRNLKIEFRAVIYVTKHVLEYRISPAQNLEYEIENSFLGIKYKRKKKYKTNWHRPVKFLNYPGSFRYCSNECYLPIFIRDKKALENFKANYNTIGEFFDWLDNENIKERNEWEDERQKYLNEHTTWY